MHRFVFPWYDIFMGNRPIFTSALQGFSMGIIKLHTLNYQKTRWLISIFQVQGIDEENARVMVKFALSGETATISQFCINLVDEKHYRKYAKYLSKCQNINKFLRGDITSFLSVGCHLPITNMDYTKV